MSISNQKQKELKMLCGPFASYLLKISGRPNTQNRFADGARSRSGTWRDTAGADAGNNPTLSANERTQTVFNNTTYRQIIQFSKQLLPNQTSYPQTDAKVTLHRHKATVSKFIIMFYWTLSEVPPGRCHRCTRRPSLPIKMYLCADRRF